MLAYFKPISRAKYCVATVNLSKDLIVGFTLIVHMLVWFMIFSMCAPQVPGNLVISARSGAHSFDASQMNMSHVISHFSFGKKITPRMMIDIKRVVPYVGGSHDKLNGQAYITHQGDNANVTVSFIIALLILPVLNGFLAVPHAVVTF